MVSLAWSHRALIRLCISKAVAAGLQLPLLSPISFSHQLTRKQVASELVFLVNFVVFVALTLPLRRPRIFVYDSSFSRQIISPAVFTLQPPRVPKFQLELRGNLYEAIFLVRGVRKCGEPRWLYMRLRNVYQKEKHAPPFSTSQQQGKLKTSQPLNF